MYHNFICFTDKSNPLHLHQNTGYKCTASEKPLSKNIESSHGHHLPSSEKLDVEPKLVIIGDGYKDIADGS